MAHFYPLDTDRQLTKSKIPERFIRRFLTFTNRLFKPLASFNRRLEKFNPNRFVSVFPRKQTVGAEKEAPGKPLFSYS